MATQATPPLPPDVTGQQAPPLAQYAEGARRRQAQPQPGQGGPGGPAQGAAPMQMVQQGLGGIARILSEIAQVLSVSKPSLMPLISRMAGAGKLLEQQVQQAAQQQGPGAPMQPGAEPAQSAMEAPAGQEAVGI